MSDPAAPLWSRFLFAALTWFIPALLVLPVYLILVALSAMAGDGTLLETTEGVRGGINAALGPLLVACGIAALVVTISWGSDVEAYLSGGVFALVTGGLGVVLWRKVLAHLRAQ